MSLKNFFEIFDFMAAKVVYKVQKSANLAGRATAKLIRQQANIFLDKLFLC